MIQVIDNFERNHKLGLIFEGKVAKGKLLVCSIDLAGNKDKPEARQLFYSLLRYADSDKFNPATSIDIPMINKILTNK